VFPHKTHFPASRPASQEDSTWKVVGRANLFHRKGTKIQRDKGKTDLHFGTLNLCVDLVSFHREVPSREEDLKPTENFSESLRRQDKASKRCAQ
jgi:hypothetical protein